ncbi:hypothetical protein Golomagni_07638 [Golovinomyces magnicellulatus]|nr:hypothetical protein Golomagni_07638 [Golovinomyces magnicellulatus]
MWVWPVHNEQRRGKKIHDSSSLSFSHHHQLSTQLAQPYVTLVSGDGFEFVVLRDAAMVSPIIKGMLDPRSA